MTEQQNKSLRQELTVADVVDMLAHFIWVPALYRTYGGVVKSEYFKQVPLDAINDETPLIYVFEGLKQFYAENGIKSSPDRVQLEHYIRDYIRKATATPEDEDLLFGEDEETSLLANLFSQDNKSLTYSTGEKTIEQFLMERAIASSLINRVNKMREFTGFVDMKEADNLTRMAEEAKRIASISRKVELETLAPPLEEFNKAKIQKIVPCGIEWIDDHIDNGQRYGDVNGIIGPTGAGKTTLASQIFAANVDEAFKDARDKGDNRICVFFTYEQKSFELQQKVFSNAFYIARNSLKSNMHLSETLSNGTTIPLKEYEIGKFGGKSEAERYEEKRAIFSKHGVIRNMSGVADIFDDEKMIELKRYKGTGGIPEMVDDLKYIQDATGMGIRAVFVDYVGLVSERQFSVSEDAKIVYNSMKRFGDVVRKDIAGEFNCVVWLLHQMSGAANKAKATTPLSHADAEGCRSLANNMANCLCLGNQDYGDSKREGGCLYLTFSKTRNSPGSGFAAKNLILKHSSLYARLDDVTLYYKPNRNEGSFRFTGDDFLGDP